MTRVGLALVLLAAGCAERGPCAGYEDCPGEGMTITYVLSTADVPPPDGLGQTVGFDLDGAPGSGTGARCDDALDFTSRVTGATNVDNQLSTNVGTIIDGPEPRSVFESRIASGELLLLFEVGEVQSFTHDDAVTVRVITARLPAGVTSPMIGADRRLLPGQTFVEGTVLATIEDAEIADGRLEIRADALPLSILFGEAAASVTIRDLRIAADIRETGLTGGELGGGVGLRDLVAFLGMLGSTTTEEELRAMLHPDLDASADGSVCDAVSLGLSFEAIFTANL